MNIPIEPSSVTAIIAVGSVAFNVYLYFRSPQEALDKRQAVSEKEVDGKAALLAQQLQWEKESNAERFKELGERIVATTTMAQNHIHTVDTKVDGLTSTVNAMNLQITGEIIKLGTIINERVQK
jgi:hypothetical protein